MTSDLGPFKTIWQVRSTRCQHTEICLCQDPSLKQALLHCWVVCPVINEISVPFSVCLENTVLVGQQS